MKCNNEIVINIIICLILIFIYNFNSTIGMPMSVFAIDKDDQIFIAEMGTNKKGEIAYLCDIIKPDMSLITNISEAHIGNFNSLEEIYIEKKNIFDSLDNDGIAFINRQVIPLLKELGVTSEQIDTMMIDVPRRYFGGQ